MTITLRWLKNIIILRTKKESKKEKEEVRRYEEGKEKRKRNKEGETNYGHEEKVRIGHDSTVFLMVILF